MGLGMIHPFLTKLATDPHLFVDHASAYAALAAFEVREAGQAWRRHVLALLACGVAGTLALAFSGLAVMWLAAVPWQTMPAPWVLVGMPVVLWVATGLLWWMGVSPVRPKPFTQLRQQFAADAQLMRDVEQAA